MKKEIKLNLGCGIDLKGGFINVDNYFTLEDIKKGVKTKKGVFGNAKMARGAKYVKSDLRKLPFPDNYADYILCVDVIEHIKMREVVGVLKEMRRVLKKSGELCLATLDFDNLMEQWMELSKGEFNPEEYFKLAQHVYGNQAGEGDGEIHKCPFTPDFMNMVLQLAGFDNYTMVKHFRGSKHPLLKGYGKDVTKGHLIGDFLVVNAKKAKRKSKKIKSNKKK